LWRREELIEQESSRDLESRSISSESIRER
jgi:hypothetical protein